MNDCEREHIDARMCKIKKIGSRNHFFFHPVVVSLCTQKAKFFYIFYSHILKRRIEMEMEQQELKRMNIEGIFFSLHYNFFTQKKKNRTACRKRKICGYRVEIHLVTRDLLMLICRSNWMLLYALQQQISLIFIFFMLDKALFYIVSVWGIENLHFFYLNNDDDGWRI